MIHFDHKSGEHFKTGDAKIYYEIKGKDDKPVLLFLHGGFGNIEDFNGILPDLEQEFKIIGIDSRGQGKSSLGSKNLTYELIQKDVERVLKHLNIDRLSIIGFSDGGIVAYRLASVTSLNIENLITIGSRWHFKNTEPTKELLSRITGESWRKKFPRTYKAYQNLNPDPNFDFLAQSVVKMWLDDSETGYPNQAVKKISCPLLAVRGDDDHLLSREAVVELTGMVRGSKLLNIPFAGHVAFDNQKMIFMLCLNTFLKDHS